MRGRLRTISIFVAIAAVIACGEQSTDPASLSDEDRMRIALNEIVTTMEKNWVDRHGFDWATLRKEVLAEGEHARSTDEAEPAIRLALSKLGDGTSNYVRFGRFIRVPLRECVSPDVQSVSRSDDIGYVKIGSFNFAVGAQSREFAQAIQDSIRVQDNDHIKGWIVDLRHNSGGNMWPMIAGAGPLIGEGTSGYFVYPDFDPRSWEYRNGTAYIGSSALQTVDAPYRMRQARPRVAVLIDDNTSNSAEAVVIAFKGRSDTRFFGTQTCGMTTSNATFNVFQGGQLNLAVARFADRDSQPYRGPIQPDEVITDPGAVAPRAMEWIRSQ
jgi:carboxyl-terminal processing protease